MTSSPTYRFMMSIYLSVAGVIYIHTDPATTAPASPASLLSFEYDFYSAPSTDDDDAS